MRALTLNEAGVRTLRTCACIAAVIAVTALRTQTAAAAVAAPPGLAKDFAAATIHVGETTTLTFQISNENGFALTNVAFTDSFPAGLQVASMPNLSNTCGGTVTAMAGASSISLSGGTVPAGFAMSCSITVDVTGVTVGTKFNTTSAVTSDQGTGNAGSDSITVLEQIPQGGACSAPSQCVTGFCADGVCCDSACNGPLEQCNLPGQLGTCASGAAPAPALTPWGLLASALMLIGIAAVAQRRTGRG